MLVHSINWCSFTVKPPNCRVIEFSVQFFLMKRSLFLTHVVFKSPKWEFWCLLCHIIGSWFYWPGQKDGCGCESVDFCAKDVWWFSLKRPACSSVFCHLTASNHSWWHCNFKNVSKRYISPERLGFTLSLVCRGESKQVLCRIKHPCREKQPLAGSRIRCWAVRKLKQYRKQTQGEILSRDLIICACYLFNSTKSQWT